MILVARKRGLEASIKRPTCTKWNNHFKACSKSKDSGEFYAVNNRGIFCSIDSGISWKMLDEHDGIQWPNEYLSQHPKALAVQDGS
jgi:hypothetical protein